MDVSRTESTRTQSHSSGWWASWIAAWIVAAPFWYFTAAILWTGGGWIAAVPGVVAMMLLGAGDTLAKVFDHIER